MSIGTDLQPVLGTSIAPPATAPSTAPSPSRRTQQQRRDGTRAALLDATVAELLERGYADLTIAAVQARAGVSRGALTHHFAAKADLVLAAMDLLYARMNEHVLGHVDDLPDGRERIAPALELVWATFDGPLFPAAMELWTAARTDPALRAALLPHERALGHRLRHLCGQVFGPAAAAHPSAEAVFDVLLTSMRGQAMTRVLNPDGPRSHRPVEQWTQMVSAVALADPPPSGPGRHTPHPPRPEES